MKEILFKRIDGARDIPCQPWPQKFYISRFLAINDLYEVRPLTFISLIKGVMTNFITMSYWRLMFSLFIIGFLDVREAEILSWKCWKWSFWKVRKRRKEEKERLKNERPGPRWRAKPKE